MSGSCNDAAETCETPGLPWPGCAVCYQWPEHPVRIHTQVRARQFRARRCLCHLTERKVLRLVLGYIALSCFAQYCGRMRRRHPACRQANSGLGREVLHETPLAKGSLWAGCPGSDRAVPPAMRVGQGYPQLHPKQIHRHKSPQGPRDHLGGEYCPKMRGAVTARQNPCGMQNSPAPAAAATAFASLENQTGRWDSLDDTVQVPQPSSGMHRHSACANFYALVCRCFFEHHPRSVSTEPALPDQGTTAEIQRRHCRGSIAADVSREFPLPTRCCLASY
ncbi:hypothetical protein D9M70_500860 [compost metagenome]